MTATRSPTVSASAWSWVTNRAGVPVQAEDVGDLGAQPTAEVGVEAGERLVEQHQAGPRGEGAGQRDPLALAARQLVRVAAAVAGQPDDLQPLRRTRWPDRARDGRAARRRCCRPPSGGGTGRAPGTRGRCGGPPDRPGGTPSSTTASPMRIVPASTWASPATSRSSVDFPQPLGPTTASSSSSSTARSRSSMATTDPNALRTALSSRT